MAVLRKFTTAQVRRASGVLVFLTGAVVWAVSATVFVPQARGTEARIAYDPDSPDGLSSGDLVALYVHDVRWTALMLAVCGLALAVAPRSWRAAIPTGIAVAAFAVANAVFGQLADPEWSGRLKDAALAGTEEQLATYAGADAAIVALATVVLIGAAAWVATSVRARGEMPVRPSSHPLAVVALAAAGAAPWGSTGIGLNEEYVEAMLPRGLLLVSQLLSASLATAAIACALAASTGRPRRRGIRAILLGLLVCAPLASLGLGWVGSRNGTWLVLFLGPLMAGVASLAWAGPDVRPWGVAWLDDAGFLRWLGLVAVSAVASFPLAVAAVLGIPLTAILLGLSGAEIGADGLPGLVTAAFGVGFLQGFFADSGRSVPAPTTTADSGSPGRRRAGRLADAGRALP